MEDLLNLFDRNCEIGDFVAGAKVAHLSIEVPSQYFEAVVRTAFGRGGAISEAGPNGRRSAYGVWKGMSLSLVESA